MQRADRLQTQHRMIRHLLLPAAILLAIFALTACQSAPAQMPAEEAAPTEVPAEEAAPTEVPVEEAAPTEAPAEEAAPTEAPAEEAAPTEAPAEEAAPTEAPAEEAATTTQGDPAAGQLVLAAAIGCGCHFNRDLGAMAGGNKFEGDFGVVHARNLTSDPATGIGGLSDQELADAIRFGKLPGGGNLFIMPRYAGMADEDVFNLIAYLRTLEPVENAVPDRALTLDPPAFDGEMTAPAVAPTEPVARGAYLASLARCGMCHTPKNEDGSPVEGMLLAGAPFRDTVAPNLTPDDGTGLGSWSEDEIAAFLATGLFDDGTEAHAGMKNVVDQGLSKLTDADRLAVGAFLKSLPPVANLPATPQ